LIREREIHGEEEAFSVSKEERFEVDEDSSAPTCRFFREERGQRVEQRGRKDSSPGLFDEERIQ